MTIFFKFLVYKLLNILKTYFCVYQNDHDLIVHIQSGQMSVRSQIQKNHIQIDDHYHNHYEDNQIFLGLQAAFPSENNPVLLFEDQHFSLGYCGMG